MIERFAGRKSSGSQPPLLEVSNPAIVQIKVSEQISPDIECPKVTPNPGRNWGDVEPIGSAMKSLGLERTYQRYLGIVGSDDWQTKMELVVGLVFPMAKEMEAHFAGSGLTVYLAMKAIAFEARFYDAATFDLDRVCRHVIVVGYGPANEELIVSISDTAIAKEGLVRVKVDETLKVDPVRWNDVGFKIERFDQMSPDAFVYVQAGGLTPAQTYSKVTALYPDFDIVYHEDLNTISELNHYRMYLKNSMRELETKPGRFGGPTLHVPMMPSILVDFLHLVTQRAHARMMRRPHDLIPSPLPVSAIIAAIDRMEQPLRDVSYSLFKTGIQIAWNMDTTVPKKPLPAGLLSMRHILDHCSPSGNDLFTEYCRHVVLRSFLLPDLHVSWGRLDWLCKSNKVALPVQMGVYPGNVPGLAYFECSVSDDVDAIKSSRIKEPRFPISESKKRAILQSPANMSDALSKLEKELAEALRIERLAHAEVVRMTKSVHMMKTADAAVALQNQPGAVLPKAEVSEAASSSEWTYEKEREYEDSYDAKYKSKAPGLVADRSWADIADDEDHDDKKLTVQDFTKALKNGKLPVKSAPQTPTSSPPVRVTAYSSQKQKPEKPKTKPPVLGRAVGRTYLTKKTAEFLDSVDEN